MFAWSFETLTWPQALVLVVAIVACAAVIRTFFRYLP